MPELTLNSPADQTLTWQDKGNGQRHLKTPDGQTIGYVQPYSNTGAWDYSLTKNNESVQHGILETRVQAEAAMTKAVAKEYPGYTIQPDTFDRIRTNIEAQETRFREQYVHAKTTHDNTKGVYFLEAATYINHEIDDLARRFPDRYRELPPRLDTQELARQLTNQTISRDRSMDLGMSR